MNTTETSPRQDIAAMQGRLHRALSDQRIFSLAEDDLYQTLTKIGLASATIKILVGSIMCELHQTADLAATERRLHELLRDNWVGGEPMLHVLTAKLVSRARLIFEQTARFFSRDARILDMGCGDGQVTDLLYRLVSPRTEGFDVRSYPVRGIHAPLDTYDGVRLPVEDASYDQALMTNVAHHSDDNEQLLRELARVVRPGGRLVVIETVPTSDAPEEFERTFVADYVYNRLFHNADVPVPGTYETAEGWVERFAKVGFELDKLEDGGANPQQLGYDQPLINDWHVLYVFRRVG